MITDAYFQTDLLDGCPGEVRVGVRLALRVHHLGRPGPPQVRALNRLRRPRYSRPLLQRKERENLKIRGLL